MPGRVGVETKFSDELEHVLMAGADLFLMPSRYGLNELPLPDDPAIRLERVPRRLMAALRFSGRTPEQRVKTKMEELLAYLNGTRWRATEAPRLAQYDPPFALPFLRRNEILVPVERVS